MELAPPEYGFGMTALDGSETARTREAKRIGKLIKKNESFFLNASNPQPLVALGYAPENAVLEFLENGKADLNYNRIMGLYKTILYSDFYTDVVRLDDGVFDKDLSKYRVLAISGASWIGPKAAERIEKFVKNGGILVADLGFEYDENFYWSSTIPAYGLDKVFGCKRDIRADYPDDRKPVATWNGRFLNSAKRRERVKLTTGKAIATWNDDLTAAIVLNNYGKGRAYYLAGEFFLDYYDSEEPALLDFIRYEAAKHLPRPVTTTVAKVIPRVLMDKDCWLVFAFNIGTIPAQSELIIDFAGKDVINFETGDTIDFQKCEGRVVITTNIPPKSTKIFKITR
jgi:beta-galactosidase